MEFLDAIILQIPSSDWAALIVPVVKPNGSIGICGDYKLTVNQAAKVEIYPLPCMEDILAPLAGGKRFTKFIASKYTSSPEFSLIFKLYGITIRFTGFTASFDGCFSIVPY